MQPEPEPEPDLHELLRSLRVWDPAVTDLRPFDPSDYAKALLAD